MIPILRLTVLAAGLLALPVVGAVAQQSNHTETGPAKANSDSTGLPSGGTKNAAEDDRGKKTVSESNSNEKASDQSTGLPRSK